MTWRKPNHDQIPSETRTGGVPGISIRNPRKRPALMTEKMTVRKYDPVLRKHVEYKEGKIK